MLAVMNEMKEFMNLALNVAFSQMHLYKQSMHAQNRYKELLSDDIGESGNFTENLQRYFDEFIHEKYQADGSALSDEEIKMISDQKDHMFYSSLVIMFRVLKTIRIQDSIGSDPHSRYLFAVACIAVANQCESNISVQPLYLRQSLSKATFVAQNYAELVVKENEVSELCCYEQVKDFLNDHLI